MGVPVCPYCGAPNVPQHICAQRPSPLPPTDGQSFAERFRGTQWDTSAYGSAPPAQPFSYPQQYEQFAPLPQQPLIYGQAQPRQSRGLSVLLLVGVASIVVAFAIMAVAFLSQPAPAPVVAVPPVTSRPVTPPPAVATAVPTPQASSPGTRQPLPPTPTPTQSEPQPLPADPALAFATRMGRTDVSFRVDCDGTFSFGNERGTMRISMAVAGSDAEVTAEVAQDRVRYKSSGIVKDGATYLRLNGEPWVKQPVVVTDDMLGSPFGGGTGAGDWQGLENVGTVKRHGQLLHHLRFPDVDWKSLSSFFLDDNAAGVTIRDLSFDIWVSPTGVPDSAHITFDGTSTANGLEADVSFDLDYRFSDFGEQIVIEAPSEFEDTDPGTTS